MHNLVTRQEQFCSSKGAGDVLTSVMGYRGPSLSHSQKARQVLRDAYDGKIAPLMGSYLAFSTVLMARVQSAQLDGDFVWVDWDHSSCDV